jgi:osmotically-inducible protein OsmY
MNKALLFAISGLLVFGAAACSDGGQTGQNNPDAMDSTEQLPDAQTEQANQDDTTNDVRQNQLESDARAREQRGDTVVGDMQRADGDLENEVRSKLETNLPESQLTVASDAGVVTITGSVPTQEQLDMIEPLAMEVKGIQVVNVNVAVNPAS